MQTLKKRRFYVNIRPQSLIFKCLFNGLLTNHMLMLKRQAIAFLIMLLSVVNSSFAQAPKKTATKETAGAAKGSLAADMDCTVKINGSPNSITVKAYTPLTVNIRTGDNSVEAISTDKKSSFKTSIKGVAGQTALVEISFFDDRRFLEYVKQGNMPMIETAIKKDPGLINNKDNSLVT